MTRARVDERLATRDARAAARAVRYQAVGRVSADEPARAARDYANALDRSYVSESRMSTRSQAGSQDSVLPAMVATTIAATMRPAAPGLLNALPGFTSFPELHSVSHHLCVCVDLC